MRFNTATGGGIGAHSVQDGKRACRRWEIYNNTIGYSGYFAPSYLRGGTGVIFGNVIASGWSTPYLVFDNRRTFDNQVPWSYCNGTAAVDGNIIPSGSPGNGWPCRDQIGRGQDTSLWTSANPYPAQIAAPAYFWSNLIGGTQAAVTVTNGSSAWIQANRDYYNQGASFDGTTGVGVGTLANRPTTCTTGVAYWATYEGEWNSLQAGTDGQLYKCTATNTWTLYYRPFPYPHPLQNSTGVSATPPAPPQNLRFRQ